LPQSPQAARLAADGGAGQGMSEAAEGAIVRAAGAAGVPVNAFAAAAVAAARAYAAAARPRR
jgi:hypothetical protein